MIKNKTIQELFANFDEFYLFQLFFPELYQQLTLLYIKGHHIDISDEIEFFQEILNQRFFYILHEIIRIIGSIFHIYTLYDFFHTDLIKEFQVLLNKQDSLDEQTFIEEYLALQNNAHMIQNYLISYLYSKNLFIADLSKMLKQHPHPMLVLQVIRHLQETEILVSSAKTSNLKNILDLSIDSLQNLFEIETLSQTEFDKVYQADLSHRAQCFT